MNRSKSHEIHSRAKQVIPGGVNSPVRAFSAVGGTPVVIARGEGCRVWDVDGNEYIDYIGSWGPLIFGHAHPDIVQVICATAQLGTSFGALTEREVIFADQLCALVPCMEMVRLVNSGTEAVMSAIRLARAATGRNLVIKFDGGYHGHSDGLMVKAGSGLATQGILNSPGVPDEIAACTISIPFNDLQALKKILDERGSEVACLIGEPVPANMGVIIPEENYWENVKDYLHAVGALLIFDEVITGFRLSPGGGQEWSGVTPDLCTLGKIIGGGLPVGAYGGRKNLMELVAPCGSVYQAGTLSGNPLAVTAGMEMLNILQTLNPYHELERKTRKLTDGIINAAREAKVLVSINQVGSLFTIFFTDAPVTDYKSALTANTKKFAAFFHACINRGLLLPPSQFEALFVSTAHDDNDIDCTIAIMQEALFEVAK
jgi:glutamate-1-semialdehyde 2,1-aminomutase